MIPRKLRVKDFYNKFETAPKILETVRLIPDDHIISVWFSNIHGYTVIDANAIRASLFKQFLEDYDPNISMSGTISRDDENI